MSLQSYLQSLTELFERALQEYRSSVLSREPRNLYEPEGYFLQIGGKRLRPVLSLMACEAMGAKASHGIHAALGLELFHNFSLVHDDIMDHAPLRRGNPTVHEKWNLPVALLVGDNILIHSISQFIHYPPDLSHKLLKIFLDTASQVCEGQQLDMDFENLLSPTLENYIEMIRKKTAVLLGCSMAVGCMAGGGSESAAQSFYQFGESLGIAFQIMDDYLDTFVPSSESGKIQGGDLLQGKKSFPVLQATLTLKGQSLKKWKEFYRLLPHEKEKKLFDMIQHLEIEGIGEQTLEAASLYSQKAIESLNKLEIHENFRTLFKELTEFLLKRKK